MLLSQQSKFSKKSISSSFRDKDGEIGANGIIAPFEEGGIQSGAGSENSGYKEQQSNLRMSSRGSTSRKNNLLIDELMRRDDDISESHFNEVGKFKQDVGTLTIEILKAELYRNTDIIGNMDPFVVMEYKQ